VSAPIAALDRIARRHGLETSAVDRLAALLEELSDPRAPTAVHDPERAVTVHVADSLAALELEEVRNARVIADLGAGAGLPGLALACALPGARVHLVESASRKCDFLRRAAAAIGLEGVEVVCARAEEWPDGRTSCDLATARALAPLAVVAEYAAPLLREGGALVAWKGRRDPADEARGARAAEELGLEPVRVVPVRPEQDLEHHHLHLYLKVRETPERFPRRVGVARKRPLGAGSAP
jgi:16S rRNA (guanine527-N7)-methyltransferase